MNTSIPSTFLVVVLFVAVTVADAVDDPFASRVAACSRRARRRAVSVGVTFCRGPGVETVKPECPAIVAVPVFSVCGGQKRARGSVDDAVARRKRERARVRQKLSSLCMYDDTSLDSSGCSGGNGERGRADRVVRTKKNLRWLLRTPEAQSVALSHTLVSSLAPCPHPTAVHMQNSVALFNAREMARKGHQCRKERSGYIAKNTADRGIDEDKTVTTQVSRADTCSGSNHQNTSDTTT